MMRIIAPWLAKAGEISASTPSLMGAPVAAEAAAVVGAAAAGGVVAAAPGALAEVVAGAGGVVGAGACVGPAGEGPAHAVTATIMVTSNPRPMKLMAPSPCRFPAGVAYPHEAFKQNDAAWHRPGRHCRHR